MPAVNNEVAEEIRKLNKNFYKLQSEISIAKLVITELTKRIVTVNRQCLGNSIAPEFIDDCHQLIITEPLQNSVVGRTSNKYFNSRKS